MAKKKQQQEEEVIVDVVQSVSKLERFFEENRQLLSGLALGIFLIVGGVIAYLKFYQQPREREAQEQIFHAQRLFEADSFSQAIAGHNGKPGFLDIAADYSGTKAGNTANYYAGISYLRIGEYDKAIMLLDDFSSPDPLLAILAPSAIGDAFMELGQKEEALEYYQKAVKEKANSFLTPFVLLKAGLLAEDLGQAQKALGYYQRIQKDFPDSRQAADIKRYIARAEAQL